MKYSVYLLIIYQILAFTSCSSSGSDGHQYFEEGKYEEAIAAYTSHIEQNGKNLDAVYNRGRAYEEVGNTELALADYNYILSIDPKHLNAQLSLAKMAYENKDFSKSVVLAGNALKDHKNSAQGQFLLARGKHQLGYANSALEAYNLAISIDDEFGEAYLYRGALKRSLEINTACSDFDMANRLKTPGANEAVEKYCK